MRLCTTWERSDESLGAKNVAPAKAGAHFSLKRGPRLRGDDGPSLRRERRERAFVEAHPGARHLGRTHAPPDHALRLDKVRIERESVLLQVDRAGGDAQQVRGELVTIMAAGVQSRGVR